MFARLPPFPPYPGREMRTACLLENQEFRAFVKTGIIGSMPAPARALIGCCCCCCCARGVSRLWSSIGTSLPFGAWQRTAPSWPRSSTASRARARKCWSCRYVSDGVGVLS